MLKIKSLLYSIDVFGTQVQILQNKNYSHHTLLGSILSLAILTFTCVSFVYMTIDMVQRQQPNVISAIEYTHDPELYPLNPFNFAILITVADQVGMPIFNTPQLAFYEPKIQYCTQQSKQNNNGSQSIERNCIDYSMIPCRELTLSTQYKKSLENDFKLQNTSYCVSDKEWVQKPMLIEGVYSSSRFSYIALRIFKCKNSSSISNCASEQQQEELLKAGFFAIHLSDRILNQKKIGNPYELILKPIITAFSYYNEKYLSFYFRHSFTETLENFFYYSSKTLVNHVLQYESMLETSYKADDNIGCLLLVNIFLDDKKITYYRSYSNILDILGSIGGLYRSLIIMAGFIMIPLTKLSQNIDLTCSIFSFKEAGYQNRKVAPENKKTQLSLQKNSFKTIFEDLTIHNRNPSFLQPSKDIRKIFNKKNKKLVLRFSDFLSFVSSKESRQQINLGLKKIEQNLDIIYIIQKLIEVDQMKELLFTLDQQKLFDYLPKPLIPSKNEEEIQISENFEIKFKEAFEAYSEARNSEDKISQRFLVLMDKEMRSIFDEILGKKIFQKYYKKESQPQKSQLSHLDQSLVQQ